MKRIILTCLCAALLAVGRPGAVTAGSAEPHTLAELEKLFLSIPDPKVAEEDLRALTSAPHIAGSPEDKKTAEFVAQKFREAGLETEIVEYKVWINYPLEIAVDVVAPPGVKMHGPRPERVSSDPYQDDPRIKDEAPAAYKDIRRVMRAQKDLVKVLHELRPLLSIKGR